MFRIFFIGLAALLMALIGAYFSIVGLSTLFAGASLEIAIMAGIMELSKLVTASFLYLYWKDIKFLLKTYLILAIIVLVTITSVGIYGFLTSAYQSSSDEYSIVQQRIENAEARRDRYLSAIQSYETERASINTNILTLSEGLANNQIQFVDRETGQLVTTTSAANRNVITQQINELSQRRELLSNRIEAYRDSSTTIDMSIINIRQSSDISRELGPLRFIADALGLPMSFVVNVLSLLIMFTLDPLAISLVIALNMAIYFRNKEKNLSSPTMYGDTASTVDEPTDKDIVEDEEEVVDEEPTVEDEVVDTIEDDEEEEETPEPIRYDEEEPKLEMSREDIDKLLSTAFVEVKTETKSDTKEEDILSTLKRDTSKRGIDLDGDGVIDGYDTNGDGIIDEKVAKSAAHWRAMDYMQPYYAKPGFNWDDKSKWVNDQNAVNYWFTHIRDKYPTDFNSKKY